MEPGPRIPPDAPGADVLAARNELALALWARGKYPTAEILLRQIGDGYANVLGEDHPAALNSMSSLASVLCCQGKYGAAETVLRRALERSKKDWERLIQPRWQRGMTWGWCSIAWEGTLKVSGRNTPGR
jgi:tetratricopeptide (TPR) repeat protein